MKIAIAGYGLEGEENYHYWSADPSNELTIVDESESPKRPLPEGAHALLGEGVFSRLDDFDLVVRTAGLAPHKLHTNAKVWSATNEFFSKCPAPIIGVTGSKGKGTTGSLITSMLRAAGKTVWLVGNIGTPSLSVLGDIQPNDVVVYEMSSFQLWDIQSSPSTAVVLYIEQEHLDVHSSMDEYVAAKENITRFQTVDDILVYNAENEHASGIASRSQARKVAYPSDNAAHIKDGHFYYGNQKLCSVDVLQLRGEHNQYNALAAIDAVWSYTQDATVITRGLGDFAGLPHRLAYVMTVRDVAYYDDSIATTPSSAIAALRSFGADIPKVIILGGSSKGSDFSELARELTRHNVQVVLMGTEAARIAAACDAVGYTAYDIITDATAEQLVKKASQLALPGGVVLLSPAAASFGLFKDYADRGDQFIAAVKHLAEMGA